MAETSLSDICRALIDIAWHFGSKGPQGECCAGLSIPDFLALDKVATTSDCPIQSIGSDLGFTKSGATRVVTRLESKDLVRRIQSLADGRVCCVHITSKGRRVLAEADERYAREFQQAQSQMPVRLGRSAPDVVLALARGLAHDLRNASCEHSSTGKRAKEGTDEHTG